jgi:hypothetical protein
MALEKKSIVLSVARVGHGGNTSEGEYFYSFDPQTLLVESPDTTVEFVLGKDTSPSIQIWKVVTSSPAQFRDVRRMDDGRAISLVNANTTEELISVTVLVIDKSNADRVVNCDPQMINVPH